VDAAGQKGTGRWSVIESQMMGVPATAIEAAVAARSLSAMRGERTAAQDRFGLPEVVSRREGQAVINDLEQALLAGKIAAYAQGFAVMAAASKDFDWNLPMATIAKIWRAGCIIRSRFLDEIASAFSETPDVDNLAMTPGIFRHARSRRQPDSPGGLRSCDQRTSGAGAVKCDQLLRHLPPRTRHGEPDPGATGLFRLTRL
jgi:6-phosphogluconate dehydrogenase